MYEMLGANILQLCKWCRFLKHPKGDYEKAISSSIYYRIKLLGGFTPAISNKIGFEEPVL